MKQLLLAVLLLGVVTGCDDKTTNIVNDQSAPDLKNFLVSEKFQSNNEYLIVCHGYPKPGLTIQAQINDTAQEAAVLNAQIYAKQKFPSIDPVKEGTILKFEFDGKSAIVYYLITHPGIKNMTANEN